MQRGWTAGLACLALCACSDSGSGSGNGGMGTLNLLVTDAPFAHDVVSEALVAITAVYINGDANADSGFLTLYEGAPIEFDLLDLQNGVTQHLAQADLLPGTYRQLRLVISDASLTLTNGNVYSTVDGTLSFSSQGTSGFKFFIDPPVEVVTDLAESLLLDFDLTKTFHPIPSNDALMATRYRLQPTVKVSNLSETGEIRGMVTADDGTGQLLGVDGATVRLLTPGELDPANSIATTGTDASGSYAMIGVAPGVYDVVVTHDTREGRVDGQQVFAGNVTVVDVLIQ